MRAKNFVVNRGVSCFIRGVSCFIRGVSCFIRGVSCFIRGVSCFIRCILSCFIRCNPVFQSWSSRRERVNKGFVFKSPDFFSIFFYLFIFNRFHQSLFYTSVVYSFESLFIMYSR